jgi:hypothetical protein
MTNVKVWMVLLMLVKEATKVKLPPLLKPIQHT